MSPRQKTRFSLDNYNLASSQVEGIQEEAAPSAPARETGRRGKRVENIPVTRIVPDPHQPRPQLPFTIAQEFNRGAIDCFEAVARWQKLAQDNPIFRTRLSKLAILEVSVEGLGLIKPATGTWLRSPAGADYFFLETGERRFWAVVLEALRRGETGDQVTLECISQPNPSRRRQAEENEKVEPLTAVGRAREIAGLLLDLTGVTPDPRLNYGPNDYHRQIGKYQFSETVWDEITQVTGLKRSRMTQYLRILDLPDDILELADAYDIPSKFLYEVVRLPYEAARERLVEVVNSYAGSDEQLSHEDILEITHGQREEEAPVDPGAKGVRAYRKVDPSVRAARRLKGIMVGLVDKTARSTRDPIGSIASSLFIELDDSEQIQQVAGRLEDLARQLRQRLAGAEE